MWILGHLASWWGFADLILSSRKCVSELPIVFNVVSYLHELFFIMRPWFGIVFAYGLIFWSNYFTCLSVVIGIASSDGGCLHINYLIFLFQIQSIGHKVVGVQFPLSHNTSSVGCIAYAAYLPCSQGWSVTLYPIYTVFFTQTHTQTDALRY